MPGGTNLPVLGGLGRGSQMPYTHDAYPRPPRGQTRLFGTSTPINIEEALTANRSSGSQVSGTEQRGWFPPIELVDREAIREKRG